MIGSITRDNNLSLGFVNKLESLYQLAYEIRMKYFNDIILVLEGFWPEHDSYIINKELTNKIKNKYLILCHVFNVETIVGLPHYVTLIVEKETSPLVLDPLPEFSRRFKDIVREAPIISTIPEYSLLFSKK